MVRCGCTRIKEVPIIFKDREAGESKLTMKQNALYLLHVLNLYAAAQPKLLLLFVLIVFAVLALVFKRLL